MEKTRRKKEGKVQKKPKAHFHKKNLPQPGKGRGEETKKKKDKHPSKTGARKGREEKDKEGQAHPSTTRAGKGREKEKEGKTSL